jgi:hypothetical protein
VTSVEKEIPSRYYEERRDATDDDDDDDGQLSIGERNSITSGEETHVEEEKEVLTTRTYVNKTMTMAAEKKDIHDAIEVAKGQESSLGEQVLFIL